jgi:hypothetical protein
MTKEQMMELLANTFELDTIEPQTVKSKVMGLFSKVETRFYVPLDNLKIVAENFPFFKNAIKVGLVEKDENGKYFINAETLKVRKTDERKNRAKQFFSMSGNDPHERTTLYDALKTICNVRSLAKTMNLEPKELKYSIEHVEGNPDEVMNYIEIDAKHFGANEEEVKKNVEVLNKHIKFKKK